MVEMAFAVSHISDPLQDHLHPGFEAKGNVSAGASVAAIAGPDRYRFTWLLREACHVPPVRSPACQTSQNRLSNPFHCTELR